MVITHNMHIPGLVPTLWRLLRAESFQKPNSKVESLVLGRKHKVRKFMPGFNLNVHGVCPLGFTIMARTDRLAQEVIFFYFTDV